MARSLKLLSLPELNPVNSYPLCTCTLHKIQPGLATDLWHTYYVDMYKSTTDIHSDFHYTYTITASEIQFAILKHF